MTDTHEHEDNCLMCAVRALTEGDPAANWAPQFVDETPKKISGVVLKTGKTPDNILGEVAYVDLWTGGTGRVRVKAYGFSLIHAIEAAAPQVGDRLTVEYLGKKEFNHPKFGWKSYREFTATVQRGH